MKSIIEELYCGRLYPAEQIVPDSPEYKSTQKKISDELDEWRKKLPDYDYTKLESLYDKIIRQSSILCTETFISSFTLGAILMMEIMQCKEDMLG